MERSPWERETHRGWRRKGSNFLDQSQSLLRSPLRPHLWRKVCSAKPFLTEVPRQRLVPAVDPFKADGTPRHKARLVVRS